MDDTLSAKQDCQVRSAMLRFRITEALIKEKRDLDWSREEAYWRMVGKYVGRPSYAQAKTLFNMLWPEEN